MNANVNQALGSDGTHLFFTQTSGTGSEVDRVNLDGTGEHAISSSVFAFSAANDGGPQIFVVNDTVYVNATSNIMAIMVGGADGGSDGGATGTALTGTEFVGGDQPGIYDAPVATGAQTGVDTGMYAASAPSKSGYGPPPGSVLALDDEERPADRAGEL